MRDRDPVEIAQIAIPVLVEAVAIILFIGCGLLFMVIASTSVPV